MDVPLFGRAVSALPVSTVASELKIPASLVSEVVRDLGLFRLRLGEAGELHISSAALPEMRRYIAAGLGVGVGRRMTA
jgi:hypothetical protein